MTILDAQVHVWSNRDDPRFPWDPTHVGGWLEWSVRPHAAEVVISDMDHARVDAAVAVVPRLYGTDNSYAIEAAKRFPDRLAVVARIDSRVPDHRNRLQALMAEPAVIGIRFTDQNAAAWSANGELEEILRAADELDVPICVMPGPSNLDLLGGVARRHRGLRLIVDHLGLEAPPQTVPTPGPDPFRLLPHLLKLARLPNIYVKMTAAASLSNEPYPFEDIWPALREVVEVFGPDRVMWGSDYNRTEALLSYSEAVTFLDAVFDSETKEHLYSGTLQRVFAWPQS